jgi:subtilisin family serine protease
MTTAKPKTKTYVMMPLRGMTLAAEAASSLSSAAAEQGLAIGRLLEMLHLNGAHEKTTSPTWVSYARERGNKRDFSVRVLDSFSDDGPKLVQAAAEGERALRAAGFQLVPLTRYKLTPTSQIERMPKSALAAAVKAKDFLRATYGTDGGANRGAGVKVAVVDSGVDSLHPALAGVEGGRGMVPGEDPTDGGACSDPNGGHGTHVAGIIGSRDPRFPGVAPGCSIRSYRVFPKDNTRAGATNYSIINGIIEAVNDGCDIINLSLGGATAKDDGVRKAIEEAWDRGVVCIAAAGNNGRKAVSYPAAHANCIAVTALGRRDLIPASASDALEVAAPFSTIDPRVFLAKFSNIGPQVDFGGPGVWIVSTLPNGEWGALSGTSMAAPAISGFAAVVLSQDQTILRSKRDSVRAEALFQALVRRAVPYKLGSFDYEGYGVPQ